MKVHRLAKYFPVLEGEEFDLFVEDIKKNGQLEPIVVVDGEILDGVNRWRACEQIGIEPKIKQYVGIDPLGYVISENIRRRHLDTSQRAMLATEMLPEFETMAVKRKSEASISRWSPDHIKGDIKESKHLARDDAAKLFGVSGPSIQRAKRIKEESSQEVIDDIIKGKRTVGEVDTELRQKRAEILSKERIDKQDDKTIKEHPKYVKEYLDATSTFKDAIRLAIKGANRIALAPESKQFIENRNDQIRNLLDELEAL